VAHLDLNLNNIVLACNDDDTNIKLVDFGFAQRVTGSKCFIGSGGTPYFTAPEILRRKPYDEKADMWSVGVIIYLLLSGNYHFQDIEKGLRNEVLKGEVKFNCNIWADISKGAKDLILKLLDTNQDTRYSAEQALLCSWSH